jgi:hypothetical protein
LRGAKEVTESSSCSFAARSEELSNACADGLSLGLILSICPSTRESDSVYFFGIGEHLPLRIARFSDGKLSPVNGGLKVASF